MKKSTKKFTSTFLAAASVAGIVVPATQAFAAEKMTLEKAKELIAYANQKKNFAAFNIAYAAILELKLDEAKQNELLAQLPAWKDVVTPDVQKALDYINIVAKNLELKDYDEAEAYMRENIKDEENKSYLLGAELTVWGKKGVYTEDVTAAVDAILKVWADKTEAAEKAAQEAIAKVKKANNVAYLNASLAEAGKDIVREVKVESVTALNAKQVQVVFNKEMDKDTANTASYYEIKDKGQTVLAATPALQADKKTVILTLDAETKLTNATSAKVTVKKDLKDISGKTLTADYVNSSVALADNKLPEVVGLKATGLKTIQITFDEPVYNGTSATIMNNQIEVKSGIYNYTVTSIKADYSRRTLTVTVGTNLLEGEISVKLNAKGMTDSEAIRDFSGLVLLSQEQKLVYSKDNSIATAELVSVNKASKKAIVKFSKPVYGSNVVLYHSVSGQSAYGTAAVTKVESAASDTWEFTFTNAIPSGNLNFYLVNDPNSANNQLTDLFGVKVPNATFTYNVVTDVVPPTVSEVKLNTNASIDVIFSEEIDLAEAKKANFEILRADGTVVQYNISNDGAKKVTLTPLSVLEDIATYTINVKAMKDVAGNAMAAAYSTTVKVGDNTNPYVSKAFTVAGEKKIFITFSEAMNESEMGNKANYLVDADGSGAAKNLVALGTDDTVTVIDNKNIVITLANAITTPSVTIAPITDLAGKRIGTNTTLGYSPAILQNISGEKLTVDKAEVIAKNKVKLTFNTSLGAFDNTDFKFVQNLDGLAFATPISIQSVESNAVNSDGKSEVVVVLDRNLNADTTYNDNAANEKVEIVVTAGNTKSANGTVLTARTHVDDALLLTDKLAGAIAVDADSNKLIETHDYDADGKIDTITVKYTEAIKEDTLSRLTFTVEGYTVTGVSVDDDGSVAVGAKGTGAGQFIVINVEEKSTPDGDATPVVRQALDITDMSDNIIVAQTAGTPALDKVTTP